MNTPSKLQTDLQKNKTLFKKLLPAEDILTYDFQTADGVACTLVYADGIVNKELLAQLVAKPLSSLYLHEKAGGMYASSKYFWWKSRNFFIIYLKYYFFNI